MMKKQCLPPARYALLTACLLTGLAQAQSINFSGDSNPTGNMGASYSTTQVTVGNSATGALAIQNGGQLVSQNSAIGQQAASTGTVVVDGPNSAWNNSPSIPTGTLTVGFGGSATLQVRNGATVTTPHLIAAQLPGSSALVEIDGANSILRSDECGFLGATNVRITNGGVLHCASGPDLNAGEVSLSGAGSKLVSDGAVSFGNHPITMDSAITVNEGTAIEAQVIYLAVIGASSTAAAVVNIEGTVTPGAINAPDIFSDIYNQGVLNLNHSDASGNYRLASGIAGFPRVRVNGTGTTTLTGNNNYSGSTQIHAGLLRAGAADSLSPNSDFLVAAGGTLDTNTYSPTLQSLDNGGTVTMAAGGTSAVLTITQNYTGNGGVIAMNTALGADSSPTQKLVVQGDTSGNTSLNISNLGGAGAATTGDGILVVQVDGASNGTFSLPAPGYVVAGGFRYALAKVGNHWYLQSDVHVEMAPEASVVCTPAELSDTANQVATCTVSLTAAPTTDLPINLLVPAANPRYTTTCTSPLVVPANATQATCTITATPNTTADDGDVTAELAIAPPSTADAYTPAGPAAQVLIKDAGATQPPATLQRVPTLGSFGLAALATLMGLLGLRRSRKTA